MLATEPKPFIIQARHLCKNYRQGRLSIAALRGVDLDVPTGAFAVLLGPSGGGKTTLLNLIGGMTRPTAGSLTVNGLALAGASPSALVRYRREQVGFVFQFFNLLPALNALDNVVLPLLARGCGWKQARQRAQQALEALGMGHRLRHRPAELSGGEQQRVAIARATVGEPLLLLADEPTGNLDADNATQIVQLLHHLNGQHGLTCLLATHNEQFCQVATQVYEMCSGEAFLRAGPA